MHMFIYICIYIYVDIFVCIYTYKSIYWYNVCVYGIYIYVHIYDEFCIEIQRESNPRGKKLRSHMVSDPNHSANRVYMIGTECFHHMWWEHSVPIIYTRLAEWIGSETIRDRSFLPRGFDSLCISMQNSSQIRFPGRGRESVNLWTRGSISVCIVYRTVAPPIAMQVASPWPEILFMRVLDPGSVGNTLYEYYHVRLQLLDYMDR